ncbi:MAG: LPS-assembly protein LptD [Hormoscilla sp. GM7CHS1pb]|nr:LPS-assembly protein LptD [Hormoscilla sp. GM7CHS1pb]
MPYPPVPPPEQPPIVYNLPPESVMEPAVRYVWLTVAPAASAKLLGPPMTVGLPIKSAAGQARQLPEVTRNDTAAQAPAAPDPLDRETGPSAPQEAIAPELQQSLIQLTADQQEYDTRRQVFTASGNVQMRFGNALLQAAKLQVNLVNRIAVAQGNVSLLTGEQLLLGERFEYNFVHGTGVISAARGSIFVPTTSEDLSGNGTTSLDATTVATGTVGEPLGADRPPENVIGTGGVSIGGDGNIPEAGGDQALAV